MFQQCLETARDANCFWLSYSHLRLQNVHCRLKPLYTDGQVLQLLLADGRKPVEKAGRSGYKMVHEGQHTFLMHCLDLEWHKVNPQQIGSYLYHM